MSYQTPLQSILPQRNAFSISSPKPIIKQDSSKDLNSQRVRTDSYGTPINNSKQHKVKFNTKLWQVHEVENWKQYNIIESEQQESCNMAKCIIF